jgi:hypothetical protein
MEKSLFLQATLHPMATVAHWAEAQHAGPSRRTLGQPMPAECSHYGRAVDLARCSMARQSIIGDKIYCTTVPTTLATHRYTRTSRVMTEEGFSPGKRMAWRRRLASTRKNDFEVDEDLQARFLSCTSMPQALEAWRRSLPAMRRSRESSHQHRAGVTCMIFDGWQRSGPMVVKHGANTTAKKRGLAMWKESPNGRAERG